MKTKLLFNLLLLVAFSCPCSVMGQTTTFSRVYYDSIASITGNAFVEAFDDGYLVAGTYDYYSGLIMKIDTAGNYLWSKEIGTNQLQLNSLIKTTDSCYVIAGLYD